MPLPSDEVFISPVAAGAVSADYAGTQTILKAAVALAILTAAATGARTATIALGSSTSLDVQYVLALLNQATYAAHIVGTDIVVTW